MHPVKTEENILVQNLKKADNHAAFNQLVQQYQEPLYWHIRNIVKNHDDTDDVLQNVFIKVHKSIQGFKGDSKLYTWMYRIATNESLTFINQKARKFKVSDTDFQERLIDQLESDVYFEGSTIQLQLQKAIVTLPQKQQLVFQMKYFQEMTFTELSTILGTSVGALKSSYHIAVKKITAHLKEQDHG